MLERKLYKTKLCILYQRGRCSRQSCSFAHGDAELRGFSGSFSGIFYEGINFHGPFGTGKETPLISIIFSYCSCNGRCDYQSSDLRNKLDRRHSPQRRYSPGRDARSRQAFHGQKQVPYDRGFSPSRSPVNRRHRKKQHLDGHSDVSESLEISNGTEDRVKEGWHKSYNSKSVLEEQLKQVLLDIDMLDDHKSQLEIYLGERVEEADSFTSRIDELETQLSKEQEVCKRTTLNIKKFIRVHRRYSRAQEELKRLQDRLQGLGDLFGSDASGLGANEEDLGISDGEPNDNDRMSPRNEVQNHASPSKKRPWFKLGTSEDSKQANARKQEVYLLGKTRLEKFTQWDGPTTQSDNSKEAEVVRKILLGNNSYKSLANEDKRKLGKIGSPSIASIDKVKGSELGHMLPSTSMAAHAVDELVEANEVEKIEVVDAAPAFKKGTAGLPYLPPPPPIFPQNTYKAV